MSGKHSRRGFQRRQNKGLQEEQALAQQQVAEAQALGQAFESALQYRACVETIIKEVTSLRDELGRKDPERVKLDEAITDLDKRLAGARKFVIHCGLELIADIPVLPHEKPMIELPDQSIVVPKVEAVE